MERFLGGSGKDGVEWLYAPKDHAVVPRGAGLRAGRSWDEQPNRFGEPRNRIARPRRRRSCRDGRRSSLRHSLCRDGILGAVRRHSPGGDKSGFVQVVRPMPKLQEGVRVGVPESIMDAAMDMFGKYLQICWMVTQQTLDTAGFLAVAGCSFHWKAVMHHEAFGIAREIPGPLFNLPDALELGAGAGKEPAAAHIIHRRDQFS